jgi:hypothetical protein
MSTTSLRRWRPGEAKVRHAGLAAEASTDPLVVKAGISDFEVPVIRGGPCRSIDCAALSFDRGVRKVLEMDIE